MELKHEVAEEKYQVVVKGTNYKDGESRFVVEELDKSHEQVVEES